MKQNRNRHLTLEEIARIGKALVRHAMESPASGSRVLREIAPQVIEASKTMSARQIAEFLTARGHKVSHPTVIRFLARNGGEHNHTGKSRHMASRTIDVRTPARRASGGAGG